MNAAISVLPASGQDRAIAIPAAGRYLVALADGAGGTGSGALAAERLIEFVTKTANGAASVDWFIALMAFDDELSAHPSGGQTTGIVACVDGEHVHGASVGDSSAWIVSHGGMIDLTVAQRRRPLLGSSEALPVVFEADLSGRRVLLGSDGLFKYAPADRICSIATRAHLAGAVDALTDCVRLPSGGFHDDVSIVLIDSR